MDQKAGVAAMVAACVIWGLSPLYYRFLKDVPTAEVLAHRTLWSVVAFSGLLLVQRRLGTLRGALGTRRAAGLTLFAALMISTNWFLFIYSVQINRTSEAALGYYIFPLVAVLLGVVGFRERLGAAQWVAVALAVVAVVILTVAEGVAPWISLTLAFSFGLYGLVKKGLSVGPVVSVTGEVVLLAPIAAGWLIWIHANGGGVFGTDPVISGLLMFSGVLTALPLVLFSRAAQRVRLATMGLIQYLNPTLQVVCAVAIFGEPFTGLDAAVFGLIWVALAIYSVSGLLTDRARRRRAVTSEAEPPV